MNATESTLVCGRDGEVTRLRCVTCDDPICPRCLTRTAVGFKCPDCVMAGERGRSAGGRGRPPAWALVALGAAVALGAVVVLRPGGGPATDPVGAPAREAPAPAGQAMLGEPVDDGQVTFTVTAFSCGETQIGARTANGKFCRLHLTAGNRSGGPATILSRFQYLLDGNARTYGPDVALSQDLSENAGRGLSELQINPGLTTDIVLVYDVPAGLDPLEAQLRGTGSSRFGVRVRLEHRP